MISRIGVDNRNLNSLYCAIPQQKKDSKNPSFKGGGLGGLLLSGIQECEKNPMLNVAVIDMLSAILPRTFVESRTNGFAGFEAFRRESSGLIVNCIIPSFIAMGFAALFNKIVMPKGSNMSTCWADHSLIDKASEFYSKSTADDKVKDSLKQILKGIEGMDRDIPVKFAELDEELLDKYAQRLKDLSTSKMKSKALEKETDKIAKELAEKTHIFENIKVDGVKATTTSTLLGDSVKFFKEFQKAPADTKIAEFAKKSKNLVKTKSALGLAVILPLAASMQYINRWITEKTSGVKGAPIYDDFGKNQDEEIRTKSKEGLFKQKIISISSMIGVGLLSMMKKPTWGMLEFKGKFPTMDQARIISTTTFSSRMAAADDKNELAEATIRDIATFSSMYFLGDYIAKAFATIIEKFSDVKLLNYTKKLEPGANIFQKFWNWVKNVNIKSSEEVISKTAEDLKKANLKPTEEQKKKIAKELKHAINMRSACQAANLGVSLLLLGLVIPILTRKNTQKKHAEAIKLAHTDSSGVPQTDKIGKETTPLKKG